MKTIVKFMMSVALFLSIGIVAADAETMNEKDSLELLKKANEGDAFSQLKYGVRLVMANKAEEGKTWIEAAADQNLGIAQNFLGRVYWNGQGCKKDYAKANKWFLMALNNGYEKSPFVTTKGLIYQEEIPSMKFLIFLHGTNKLLTCKDNTLVFEEGEPNEANIWTLETARDRSTAHYMPILKSLLGKYLTGEESKPCPAGLGEKEDAADIEISLNENGGLIEHDGRYLGMKDNTLYWVNGNNAYSLDITKY